MDGGSFAAINTCFKLVDFCLKLKDVSIENQVFLRLIQRVRDDLNDAFGIMRLPAVQAHFVADPAKQARVESCILSVKRALESIGKFVESVRLDQERTGSIGMMNRFEWVLRHQSKLQTRQAELDTCHRSLLEAMAAMRLWEMNPLLPSYSAATGQTRREGDSDDSDTLLSPHERLRRRKAQNQENLIDLGGSYADELRAISPSAEIGSVVPGVDTKTDVLDVLAPPAYTDTKVFLTEVESTKVDVGFAPGTGNFDEKQKSSFPPSWLDNSNSDEKKSCNFPAASSGIGDIDQKPMAPFGLESSIARKPLPVFDIETRTPGKSKVEFESTNMPQRKELSLGTQQQKPENLVIEETESAMKSTWGPENWARPGWEVFELDTKPLDATKRTKSFTTLAELDSAPSRNAFEKPGLNHAPSATSRRSMGEALPAQAGEIGRGVMAESSHRTSVSELYSSLNPGPAPYVLAKTLRNPPEPSMQPISPISTTSTVEPVQTPVSQIEAEPRTMHGYFSRYGPVSRQYLETDPIALFDSPTVRKSSVPSQSTSTLPRRPVPFQAKTYPGLSPFSPLATPITSGLTHRIALAQDSLKEVQMAPPELPPRHLPSVPTDSLKEVLPQHPPPLPPKLPQRPASERINSGYAAEDTMKVSLPNLPMLPSRAENDTNKVPAAPEQHSVRQSRSFEQPKSMLQIGEEALRKTSDASKAVRDRRKAMRDLILGSDDSP